MRPPPNRQNPETSTIRGYFHITEEMATGRTLGAAVKLT